MNSWNAPAERQFRYFLSSERIGFRLWTADDLPLAQKLWGDPQVTSLFVGEPLTEQQVADRLHAEIVKEQTYGVQYWPIFERGSDDFLGCCGLRPYKVPERIYELGFHLVAGAWGQGYATEGAKAVINYGIKDLTIKGFFAGHHPDNLGSKKVLLNCGFVETGSNFYEPTGLFHPSYMLKSG
ncbi:MAG: GNAT family N-acetyltransferase [Candidatus Obscuribacterales bacterium]|nr:GNAT family N-acetyltransferase [Candidatus Obscuribacterales bacterium]